MTCLCFCTFFSTNQSWGGNYWEYMAEFWNCRGESNVLLVPFENLKEDLEGNIPTIARFMGLWQGENELGQAEPHMVKKVAQLASLSYMSEHDDQFSEGW